MATTHKFVVSPVGMPGLKRKRVLDTATSTPLKVHAETMRFLKKLNKLKRTGNVLADYEELRDEILHQTERIATHGVIFAEVVNILVHSKGWKDGGLDQAYAESRWAEFITIAKTVDSMERNGNKRKEPGGDSSRNERQRKRDFASIVALRPPELVA